MLAECAQRDQTEAVLPMQSTCTSGDPAKTRIDRTDAIVSLRTTCAQRDQAKTVLTTRAVLTNRAQEYTMSDRAVATWTRRMACTIREQSAGGRVDAMLKEQVACAQLCDRTAAVWSGRVARAQSDHVETMLTTWTRYVNRDQAEAKCYRAEAMLSVHVACAQRVLA